MENMFKKVRTQSTRNANRHRINVFGLWALLFACTVLFAFGCGESSQTTAGRSRDRVSAVRLTPQAMRIVRTSLADPDPPVRSSAVEVVAATQQLGLMPKVQRLMTDEVAPVRFLAILAVGDLQYALAENELRLLLKDKDENVRIAAAYALTKLGRTQYAKVFCDAITSRDQTVRANAALLLGKSGDQTALKYLYWTLQSRDSHDKVILQAAESIAMLGDEQIYPKLWTRLISAYADDRVVGVRAMGALGTERAKGALITMLDDAVLEVRLAAAGQLGRLGQPIGEPQVLDVFTKNLTVGMDGGDLERVRVLTALAIGEIGTDNLLAFLPQFLQDESKFVRLAAAKAVFQYVMRR
jgi:HEAT repeat protein